MFSNCEYIVVVENGKNNTINLVLTDEEKDKIYKIIMTYSFPINTNPINKIQILKLTSIEKELLTKNEKQFLEKKISEALNGINVTLIPIPKTLYQLFYLKLEFNKASKASSSQSRKPTMQEFDLIPNQYTGIDDEVFEHINKTIYSKEVTEKWWDINAALFESVKPYLSEELQIKSDKLELLCSLWYKEIQDNLKKSVIFISTGACGGRSWGYYLNDGAAQYLQLIIQKEFQNKNYLLYSGAGKENKPNAKISWSMSDGLLAGSIYDLDTGCACTIWLKGKTHSFFDYLPYVTAICPQNYWDMKEEYHLFFIPPIPSILKLNGSIEFHHPRTKVTDNISPIFAAKGQGVSGMGTGTMEKMLEKRKGFLLNSYSCEKHEKLLTAFIERNREEISTTNILKQAETDTPLLLQWAEWKQVYNQKYPHAERAGYGPGAIRPKGVKSG